MALLNFPSSPTNGQVYTTANGVSYQYNGAFWSGINTSFATGGFTKLDNISSSFNGSNTTFNLTASGVAVTPGTAQNLVIVLGGVIQEPANSYNVSTSTITFSSAPSAGMTFSGVMLGAVMNLGVPSDSTVTSAKLDSNISVSANLSYGGTLTGSTGVLNIGSGQIYKDSSGNVGIGTSSPTATLHVNSTSGEIARLQGGSSSAGFLRFTDTTNTSIGYVGRNNTSDIYLWQSTANSIRIGTNNLQCAQFDSSGNLGLGVTPSGWGSIYNAFQAGNLAFAGRNDGVASEASIALNAYRNTSNSWTYKGTGAALYYGQGSGGHAWYNAPSGTAGNTISFTQAMTLDATGNLCVGTTTSLGKITTSGAGDQTIWFTHSDNVAGRTVTIRMGNTNGVYYNYSPYIQSIEGSGIDNYSLAFGTSISSSGGAVERLRIDSYGRLIVQGAYGNGTLDSTDPGIYFNKQSNVAETNIPYIKSVSEGATTSLRLGPSSSSGSLQFYTVGSERARIDASGRFTVTYQPSFKAQLTANQSYSSGIQKHVAFTTVHWNTGNCYSTSTGRFTAPVAGYYFFEGSESVSGGTASSYLSLEFYVNGTRNYTGWNVKAAGYQKEPATATFYLNASDYVEVGFESAVAITFSGNSNTSAQLTYWSGRLIC